MRHTLYYLLSVMLMGICCTSCIYPYDSGVEGAGGQVVIEGTIYAGAPSLFTLSLTRPISETDALTESIEASSVVVESEDGTTYKGVYSCESSNKYIGGKKHIYSVPTENISTGSRSRVVITAPDGTVYTSEWVPFVTTPPIDSVFYEVSDDNSGMSVLVDTHASDDDSRYYGWTFTEDWEFTSQLRARYYYEPDSNKIYEFEDGENTYYCWNHNNAPDINFFSTENLSSNIVSRHEVTRLTANTLKVQYIYAIEVCQRCVSEEEYHYWKVLLENSEGTGDLFSTQPNEMRGNITSSDPSETVVGYIGAGDVEKLRIFIDCRPLHLYNKYIKYEVENYSDSSRWNYLYYKKVLRPYYYDEMEMAYYWSSKECLDCRISGNKNKPDFWPNDHK